MQINNWEKALGIYYNENTASKKRKKMMKIQASSRPFVLFFVKIPG